MTKLSASAIADFKRCPTLHKLKRVDRIIPIEDPDYLRVGTNWHKLLEVASMEPESVCPLCAKLAQSVTGCIYCCGSGFLPKDTMDLAVRFLWDAYTIGGMLVEGREVEYYTLLNSLAAYNWYWTSQEQYKTVARELEFETPIRSMSGRALPNVSLRGMIDKIVQNEQGQFLVLEHKTTGSSIDSDSTFWQHLGMGVQSYLYPGTAQTMQADGELRGYGITPKDPPIYGMLFDVFHKPQIKPKKLTQKDSKEFIETGVYCGQEFEVTQGADGELKTLSVNNVITELEWGAEPKAKKDGTKKPRPFAIKETPEMFGARLLNDISERPEFYFARREVARTDSDFGRFRRELLCIYQTMRLMKKNCGWYHCDDQCEATFKCPYMSICYADKDVSEVVPDGFKKI
ncbi:MAG: PD-(D/E)XK nuclease family protein [Neptuniibacter sp.]|nr:PD-(D/E)XK nuclease family protein [Neptuniibacter sp.]MCP4596225.1 PD-(D/E)XK nuclease family protein [Neptuniibacter sp.]